MATLLCAIYTQSNEIHNVVALIKCLLVLRVQLYMFRTVCCVIQYMAVTVMVTFAKLTHFQCYI